MWSGEHTKVPLTCKRGYEWNIGEWVSLTNNIVYLIRFYVLIEIVCVFFLVFFFVSFKNSPLRFTTNTVSGSLAEVPIANCMAASCPLIHLSLLFLSLSVSVCRKAHVLSSCELNGGIKDQRKNICGLLN